MKPPWNMVLRVEDPGGAEDLRWGPAQRGQGGAGEGGQCCQNRGRKGEPLERRGE